LGVERTATSRTSRRRTAKLAHKSHPDGRPNAAEAKFKDVAKAYATLKDPEKKRGSYDNLGQTSGGERFTPTHRTGSNIPTVDCRSRPDVDPR